MSFGGLISVLSVRKGIWRYPFKLHRRCFVYLTQIEHPVNVWLIASWGAKKYDPESLDLLAGVVHQLTATGFDSPPDTKGVAFMQVMSLLKQFGGTMAGVWGRTQNKCLE